MATNFPGSQDSFTNPTASDTLDSPDHAAQHANVNDAVEAIELALLDGAPLHIDDTNERVGIGTTSPSSELEVAGTAPIVKVTDTDSAGSSNGQIQFRDSADSLIARVYPGGNDLRLDGTLDRLILQTGSTDRLTVDSSGNVGIGTTSPSYTLDVNGTLHITGQTTADGDVYFQNNALVASNAGSTNIDHIWHDDGSNSWNFCSDTTYKAAGNSAIVAGSFSGNGSGLSSVNAATLGGLGLSPGSSAPSGSQVIRSHTNGYTYLGWINTPSGATTSTISRIYASNDTFVRYVTPATFRSQIIDGQAISPSSVSAASGSVSGTLSTSVITVSNEIQLAYGSVTDPSITWSSDGDTGIYGANDRVYITTSGTMRAAFGNNFCDMYGESRFYYDTTSNDWSAQPIQAIADTANDIGIAIRSYGSDTHTTQMRVSSGILFIRSHNDGGYHTVAAIISNQSSRNEKQDIIEWTPPAPVSAGSMTNPEYATTMSLLNQLDVVSYRWDKERYCIANEVCEDDPEHDDTHICGRDCDQTPEAPCNYYRNWERGTVGLVAEDVGAVIPQITNIDMETGENTAIDGLALSAVIVKALQEIDSRLSALEAS